MGKMSTEWHNAYNRQRHNRIRKEYIKTLGGKCVRCASKRNLHFDHIDASTKAYDVGAHLLDSRDKVMAELAKCQLLCQRCHIAKTREGRGQADARKTHGTLSSYRYCKCKKCKAANATYTREHRRKYGRKKAPVAQLASALDP